MIRLSAVPIVLCAFALACGSDNGTEPTQPPVPSSLVIAPSADTIGAIGDTIQLQATVHDQNGAAMSDVAVAWTSADAGVATVNATGQVVSVATGTAHIHATAGDLSADAVVVVLQSAASVTLSVPDDTLAEGDTVTLAAVVKDANGVEIADAPITWTSSDSVAATVDSAGRVTAVWGDATPTITATAGGAHGEAAITVLGKVLFTSERTGSGDLYLMNSDGSGVTLLASSDSIDEMADWSPDGSKIVFRSTRDGNSELYVMNADGTDVTRLTTSSAYEEWPVWSPDGTRIAFVYDSAANFEIYVMDANGSHQVRLTNSAADDQYPSWSPDGSHIVFTSDRDGELELYVMTAEGTAVTPLTTGPAPSIVPIWSRDGSRIAFASGRDDPQGDAYVMNADGSNVVRLTDTPKLDAPMSWSPDGSKLLFISERDGNDEIYVMNVDGSGERNLTLNSATDVWAKWQPRPAH